MKIYHFFVAVTLVCLLPGRLSAKAFSWYRGGTVTYTIQKKHSPVVSKAAQLFSKDMFAVTGKNVKGTASGDVLLYQLDMASNKDMKALGSMKVPILDFIARHDAFWMGVRNGKIVIVGSNGRGTAYGLMHLSRLCGITPWMSWGNIMPEQKKRLEIDDQYETIQSPSVEYRAISLEDTDRADYHKLFELMLRLHANGFCEGWDKGEVPDHFVHNLREIADSFGIALALPHGSRSLRLQEHKRNTTVDIDWTDDNYGYVEPTAGKHGDDDDSGAIYHLSYGGQPHPYLWFCTTQPGLIANEIATAYSKGARRLWMVALNNPGTAAYQLSLLMDMAWNIDSAKPASVSQHLGKWLTEQFGRDVAKALARPIADYFQLSDIRRPEMMDFKQGSNSSSNGIGFNAEEFGNELERYLNNYADVCRRIERASSLVSDGRKDMFFTTIWYPVRSSALQAVKMLEAQEARLIGRPASFHHDDEALESAARSIKAYEEIQQLTARYNDIVSKHKWARRINTSSLSNTAFAKPVLPDTLSRAEVEKYSHYEPLEAKLTDDNTIVRHAYEYTEASKGARRIEMLGRSMKAVELGSGDSLSYNFRSPVVGGVLRLAFVPTHELNGGSLQCSVSIDGKTPTTVIITDGSRSNRWADGVLRGQSLIMLPVSLTDGMHRLTIKALSDHVIFDQWMIDRDQDRQFYVFPRRQSNSLF